MRRKVHFLALAAGLLKQSEQQTGQLSIQALPVLWVLLSMCIMAVNTLYFLVTTVKGT